MKDMINSAKNWLLLITLVLLPLVSCTPGSCLDETEAFVKANLYSFRTKKITAPDSITAFGLNMSDKLYQGNTGVRIAKFPLNSSNDSSVFIVKINNSTDTVIFRHTSYPHLISKECGYTYYHELTDTPYYTKNAIVSIATKKKIITTLNEENISIYY